VNRLLAPLATGFKLGVALRRAAYRHGWFKTHRLNRPVVSVGNLTTGGTGKTPLVRYIAELFLKCGRRPSILTRGYGRQRGADMVVIASETERKPDPRAVGDEPALLARALPKVPIVVCADRYRGGRLAEERCAVEVHILDDGFQHWSLARDVDVVLLDVTQELSDQALLPAGRQREPLSALERAHIAILTRTELCNPQPFEKLVRRINPRARIFRCRTKLSGLVDVNNGKVYPPTAFRGEPVHAFCGIGNPNAFFSDLKKWGLRLTLEIPFRDHHIYSVEDLLPIMAGAEEAGAKAIVMTEKDAMNTTSSKGGSIPFLVCVIETEIDDAQGFEETLVSHLEAARTKR
jgi:tetraacyldisaccharide 4'-kinase